MPHLKVSLGERLGDHDVVMRFVGGKHHFLISTSLLLPGGQRTHPLEALCGAESVTFSKISPLSSAVVINKKPSRRLLAFTSSDPEMSIAIKQQDLRCVNCIIPQEERVTIRDIFIIELEFENFLVSGSKLLKDPIVS